MLGSFQADARISAATTDDLTEGTNNLYYTNARADARIAAATTDDLTEGTSSIYYTDARADARIAAGNSASATILANSRTIGGVSFNGSANIDLPGVNAVGNQNTTGSASKVKVLNNNNINKVVYPVFVDGTSSGTLSESLEKDTGLTYNGYNDTLTAGTFSGNLSGSASNMVVSSNNNTNKVV